MGDELKIIAEQLGTTVEFIWPIMVRAQYVQALYAVVFNLVFSTSAIYAVKKIVKRLGDGNYANEDERILLCILSVMLGAVVLIGLAWMSLAIYDAITPEYTAFKELLRLLGK